MYADFDSTFSVLKKKNKQKDIKNYICISENGDIYKDVIPKPDCIKSFCEDDIKAQGIVTLKFVENLNKLNLSLFGGIKYYNLSSDRLIGVNKYFFINDKHIAVLNENVDLYEVVEVLDKSDTLGDFLTVINQNFYLAYCFERGEYPNLLVVVNEQQIYQDILKDLENL